MGSTCSVHVPRCITKTSNTRDHSNSSSPALNAASSTSSSRSQNASPLPLHDTSSSATLVVAQNNPHTAHSSAQGRPSAATPVLMPEAHHQMAVQSSSSSLTPASLAPSIPEQELVALRGGYAMLNSEVEALESLNLKSKTELNKLFHPSAGTSAEGGAEYAEMLELLDEITQRNRLIRERRLLLAEIERRMRRLGHSPQRPAEETAYSAEPEDPSLCHFCITRPVTEVYTCCQYRGACSQCIEAMRRASSSCPHCRCRNPAVVPL